MNEYVKRLHELAAAGALSAVEVAEVVACAGAAGVRVEMEHVDLRTGEKRRWVVEADGTRSDLQPAPAVKAPKKRRIPSGVQVVGQFQWEVPDEIEAGPQPQKRQPAKSQHPGLPSAAADAGAAGFGLFSLLD